MVMQAHPALQRDTLKARVNMDIKLDLTIYKVWVYTLVKQKHLVFCSYQT